jgi:uncharacterized membrane protein
MHPIMRIVLPVIGALIGASLGHPATRTFDILIGAIAGFAVADLGIIRARLDGLAAQVDLLTAELRRRREVPAPPTEHPESVSEPQGSASPSPGIPVASPVIPASRPQERSELPIVSAIRGFLTGGNALVRAGVIILFFGVAFLLRYMAEHTHVPIEFRLTGIALGGLALLMFGWRVRTTRSGYAFALQGGGVGILYLTVFAALRLYSILPAAIAFPILATIAIISAALAVMQNSISFALLAVIGGFLAPVLASIGQGSHVVLFSYYLVLNAGILAVAWFKAWRPLNIAGFVFTFAIGTGWGVLQYRPEDFATTEPFLVLFFLFYHGISILFTLRQPVKLSGYIDGTLIFGTPIAAFALQSAMLHERVMSLAYSAIALSALYLTIAWLLTRRHDDSQKAMREAFIALGVAFLTLAIPLAMDARLNAATWALEGAALVWVGCRQDRILPRVFGALFNGAAGCVAATQFDMTIGHAALPLGAYFGVLIQSVAAIFSARTLHAARQRLRTFEQLIPDALYWWGASWWLIGGLSEIFHYLPTYAMPAALVLVSATALASSEIHRRTLLGAAKIVALLQLPAMLGFAARAVVILRHPSAAGGWLAWPPAFAALSSIIYRHEGAARAPLATYLNAAATWLFCALLSWEAAWQINSAIEGSEMWPAAAWAAIPGFFLYWLPRLVMRVKWPFASNRETYLFVVGVGIAFYLAAWSLVTNGTSFGDAAPLPYVPLLNPLDLAQAFVLLVLLRYWRFLRAVHSTGYTRIDKRVPLPALAALTFIWLNAVLVRTLHQWFDVAYGLEELMRSTLVQTSLSIFWAILALLSMLVAGRRRNRLVWLVGAALLAVVIAKLFLVDLSKVGSVERIVSFVGVGLLMLVVGYFSPLPPAREARQ